MAMWWAFPDPGVAAPEASLTVETPAAEPQLRSGRAIRPQERACCCPAAPQYRVVVPVSGERRHATDLLLCAHHYHASRAALVRLGAGVFDHDGALVS